MLRKQIRLLILVAGRDQLPETIKLELLREECKKIAHARIITVAVDHLVPEMRSVMSKLILYITQLRVELVLFGPFCSVQIWVLCHDVFVKFRIQALTSNQELLDQTPLCTVIPELLDADTDPVFPDALHLASSPRRCLD